MDTARRREKVRSWLRLVVLSVVALSLLPPPAGRGSGATTSPPAHPTAVPVTAAHRRHPALKPTGTVRKSRRTAHGQAPRIGYPSVTARRDPASGYRLRIAVAGAVRPAGVGQARAARVLTPLPRPRAGRQDPPFVAPHRTAKPSTNVPAADGLPAPAPVPLAPSSRLVPADAAHTVVVNTDDGRRLSFASNDVAYLQAHRPRLLIRANVLRMSQVYASHISRRSEAEPR